MAWGIGAAGPGRVEQQGDALGTWRNLFQQLQPFSAQRGSSNVKPVMLPPGCESRRGPLPIGSDHGNEQIGMARVSRASALTTGVV